MPDPAVTLDELRQAGPGPDRHGRRRPSVRLVVIAVVGLALVGGLLADVHGRSGGPGGRPAPVDMPALPVLGPARDVYDGDLGDPFVLPVTRGGKVTGFVAFGTGDWPARVPTARSSDLTTWQEGPDALPALPAWAAADPKNSLSWAPAAVESDHGYVLYVTLPEARSGQQCIAAARAAVPEGPYTGVGDGPLLCQHELGGSIDPSVVRDRAGRLHLLWKNDGNSIGAPSGLWEQRLTADGLGTTGTAHRLLDADMAWQGGIVEEPAMIPASGGGWVAVLLRQLLRPAGVRHRPGMVPNRRGPVPRRRRRPLPGDAGIAAGAPVRARRARDVPGRRRGAVGGIRHLEPPGPQRPLLLLSVPADGAGALLLKA